MTTSPNLSLEDRLAIHELLALHGHLMDDGALDRMDELFTDDVVYDVSDFGMPPLRGRAAIREAALAVGDRNPVGHHVTNVVILGTAEDGAVRVRSKGLGVNADGTCGSAAYEDLVVRTGGGWRIRHRVVTARRTPLGG